MQGTFLFCQKIAIAVIEVIKVGRQARRLSQSGFYHLVFRGINHQQIFEDERDYDYFLKALQNLKADLTFEWKRYCIMSHYVPSKRGKRLQSYIGIEAFFL